jgi:superfamily II DNA or RNA helicase
MYGGVPAQISQSDAQAQLSGSVLKPIESDPKTVWLYEVSVKENGKPITKVYPENCLVPTKVHSASPMDFFRALSWHEPKSFLQRWKFLLAEARWYEDSAGIPTFLGARVHPLAHQLYAARRVLWDHTPRFVLADEVGLGKTIEAGFVIQALRCRKPNLKVLIVAPGSMARQWQTELYLRFGGQVFQYVDNSSLSKVSSRPNYDSLIASCSIVTTTALQTYPNLQAYLENQGWDLLVIDEAHQFSPGTPMFSFFHRLASRCNGLLALSATPSKRELKGLSGLLSLVSPHIYKPADTHFLEERINLQREVWDRLSFTSKFLKSSHDSGIELSIDDLNFLAEQWDGILEDDEIVLSLIKDLKGGRVEAASELIAYVQEFHRIDHRIIRTRRATIESKGRHWSDRTVSIIQYEPDTEESVLVNHFNDLPTEENLSPSQLALRGLYCRILCTSASHLLRFLRARLNAVRQKVASTSLPDSLALLTGDPGPSDEVIIIQQIISTAELLPEEEEWLNVAIGLAQNWEAKCETNSRTRAVVKWLNEHLTQSPEHQVLIFAQDVDVVTELAATIQDLLPHVPVRSFHHKLGEAELSKIALQFQQNKDCRVLVSDELGGEGRNFQNASGLVHFDLPWSVSRIEQRIGRLDRVGRDTIGLIESTVLCGPSIIERAVLEIHQEVFKVLNQSVGGLEYALPNLQSIFNDAICRGITHLTEIKVELKRKIEKELEAVDEAFELSLDTSRVQLDEAQQVVEWVNDSSSWESDSKAVAGWAAKLGIKTRKLPRSGWEFQWQNDGLKREVTNLKAQGFITGSFSRKRALADESRQFLGPGHPFVDALVSDLHTSGEGRAAVFFADLGHGCKNRVFLLVLCRAVIDDSPLSTFKSAPNLILRAQRFSPPEVLSCLFELDSRDPTCVALVNDPILIHRFQSPKLEDPQWIHPDILRKALGEVNVLWEALEEAVKVTFKTMRNSREEISLESSKQLMEDLQPELGYLAWLQAKNGATNDIAEEIKAREVLVECVKHERIELDSIAVVVGR